MVTITARSAQQREALDWMLGKPLPEGYEEVGLTHDEEWDQFALDVTRVGHTEVDAVEFEDQHLAPFLAECRDGVSQLEGIAADWQDPKTKALARALQNLIDRYEESRP